MPYHEDAPGGFAEVLDTALSEAESLGFNVQRMVIVMEGTTQIHRSPQTHVLSHGYYRANQRMTEEASRVIALHRLGTEDAPPRQSGLRPEDPEKDPAAPGLKDPE